MYVFLGALFVHDWDGYVFESSVRDLWAGGSPYRFALDVPYYAYLNPTDVQPQWYAYPPLPLFAMAATFAPVIGLEQAFGLAVQPVVERLLLKVPIILGTLALAWVAGRWARHWGHDEATVVRVEKLLLFNPFLVLVGPVWGMTDTCLMALLLYGMLQMELGRPRSAGVFMAMSVLVKPFPLLLALPLVAYYVHRMGFRPVMKASLTGVPTLALVCLPFLVFDPVGFWNQVVGVHLLRDAQGLTIWSVGGLAESQPGLVRGLSLTAIAVSLLVLSLYAHRLTARSAPVVIVLAGSSQILLWNRVVNEQYLTMAIAPLLLLGGVGALRTEFLRRSARWVPHVFALVTAVRGFHFIRFIPPDVGAVLFPTAELGKYDVTIVVNRIRNMFNWGWNVRVPEEASASLVAALLVLLAVLGWQAVRLDLASHVRPSGPRRLLPGTSASAMGCAVLILLGVTTPVTPAADRVLEAPELPEQPLVGAFYYLWWDNPAHDPELPNPYGNWWEATQFSDLGYYSQTRGVARLHARMMHSNGIDVAIVSYHTGEYARYRTFQEEAGSEGVLVAPLMELNQIYDQPENRPVNWSGQREKHASYSLTNRTREAIEIYVLELKETLQWPNAYRIDGRPVIFFYDSYVGDVGYGPEERLGLAQALRGAVPIETLRDLFADPTLDPTVEDLLRHYPPRKPEAFYDDNTRTAADGRLIHISAPWRAAHFEHYRAWWNELRATLERELGPVFLVSGDAWNEQAGFYAGIIKNIEDLTVFDGSFIYSPSFTWGVQDRDCTNRHYSDYFKLWTYRNLWLTAFAEPLGSASAFGVAPAYDDTFKRGDPCDEQDGRARKIGFRIPARHNGSWTYDLSWRATLNATPTLPVVATFNEFFEGSSIEPGRWRHAPILAADATNPSLLDYGDQFLRATAEYRGELAQREDPGFTVLNVVHERSSRLHPRYSQMDKPHFWGLKLIGASQGIADAVHVQAVDALETSDLPGLRRPDLLLVEGGFEDFEVEPALLARLESWVAEGVPTLLMGREIAPDLQDLAPADCRVKDRRPSVPGEEVTTLDDPNRDTHDDVGNDGDVFRLGHNQSLVLDRVGVDGHLAGVRCEASSVAFMTIKPWTRLSETSQAPDWAKRDCLAFAVRTLFPELGAVPGPTCRIG